MIGKEVFKAKYMKVFKGRGKGKTKVFILQNGKCLHKAHLFRDCRQLAKTLDRELSAYEMCLTCLED